MLFIDICYNLLKIDYEGYFIDGTPHCTHRKRVDTSILTDSMIQVKVAIQCRCRINQCRLAIEIHQQPILPFLPR